jgi:uncharacterized protein (DUF3084 family)
MPRGSSRSLNDRIEELQSKLEKKQAEAAEIKNAIKELQSQKQAELLAQVTKAAAQKGVSVEELLKAVL